MGRDVDKVNQLSDEALTELVHQVAFRLRAAMHDAIATESVLSHMEARALDFFARHPDATATDLVKRSGRDKGQIARLIGELVDHGFVERVEGGDRRSHTLSLTADGRAMHRRVQLKRMAAAGPMFAGFDATERAQLADFLRRIAGDNEEA